ncbi:MerR family transcriptional regulator [Caulobacter sp.]|uniref:MerR family transcriptional regulator n=1 Tax=Caulobacter sp. TaxID=78 RepID=UPI003BAE74EC
MPPSARFLGPSDAARQLGVSAKALRIYEARGLLVPARTAAGWRAYGPDQMARAGEIVSLRALGLSLSRIAEMLSGQAEPALAAHQAILEDRIGQLTAAADKIRDLRAGLAPSAAPAVAFDLPWPWGGERFELARVPALTFVTGPLGSGKTRLARRLALALDAVFLDLDRPDDALPRALEGTRPLVIDMPERGLDRGEQEALVARLRRRGQEAPAVVLLTRSSAILDLSAVGAADGADEAILYCPANHAPPMRVTPRPGAPGHEALTGCLASPSVRARTEGMMAVMPSTC